MTIVIIFISGYRCLKLIVNHLIRRHSWSVYK